MKYHCIVINVGLRDIYLKKSYDSGIDDVLTDFYVPSLSNSIKYKRLAGFFSSSSLAVAARGISSFIKNNGKVEIVCSAKLSKDDINAIKNAIKNPIDVIRDSALSELENLEEGIIKDHVAALGWMIANKKLKMKIAIQLNDAGLPLDESYGIFHLKLGILIDEEDNKISFSGSINETEYGWKRNIEEFKVFRNWDKVEKDYFDDDLRTFKRYWNGEIESIKVYDIPEAVEKELINIAPTDFKDLNLDTKLSEKKESKIRLWDHQTKAIKNWLNSGMTGIFEMATGTGKTFTALGCLEEFFKKNNKSICIIACPYAHLIDQWIGDIEDFGFKEDIIVAYSGNQKWKRELNDYILDINNDICEKLIILTTHDTLSSKKFIEIISSSNTDIFLIVDEVHGIGSNRRREGLLDKYDFKLGLSATPTRWFDKEGTDIIIDYFGDVIFSFTLENALTKINQDTGEYYLTPYEYHPYFIELTSDELREYEIQSNKISKAYHFANNKKEQNELMTLLLNKRQRIINNAQNKYKVLSKILENDPNIKHLLVYCSPQQMDKVQDILLELRITPQSKFTMSEGTRKEEKFGGISERDFLLKEFSKGNYRALVAMKCLDEGVDVPAAKTAIIMSSTSNPREYIQRRGRVLRRSNNKKLAIIYDLVVMPKVNENESSSDIEKKIRKKEIQRYKEFARSAKNSAECLEELEKYIYGG